MVNRIDKDSFEKEVLNEKGLVVVDFFAGWCGPCMMMSPIIDELSEEYEGKIKFCKINVDDEEELAIKYGAMSIPLFLVFKDGEVVARNLGYQPKEHFEKFLNGIK